MNNSKPNIQFDKLRKSEVLAALSPLTESQQIDILIDKVFSLQDALIELQSNYAEVLVNYNRLCAQVPF